LAVAVLCALLLVPAIRSVSVEEAKRRLTP